MKLFNFFSISSHHVILNFFILDSVKFNSFAMITNNNIFQIISFQKLSIIAFNFLGEQIFLFEFLPQSLNLIFISYNNFSTLFSTRQITYKSRTTLNNKSFFKYWNYPFIWVFVQNIAYNRTHENCVANILYSLYLNLH